jgi:hypothetical protein
MLYSDAPGNTFCKATGSATRRETSDWCTGAPKESNVAELACMNEDCSKQREAEGKNQQDLVHRLSPEAYRVGGQGRRVGVHPPSQE